MNGISYSAPITEDSLTTLARIMAPSAVLFFKGLEGGACYPPCNLLDLAFGACCEMIIAEGIIDDIHQEIPVLMIHGGHEKMVFRYCLVQTLQCICSDFYEYYVSLRGLGPHTHGGEKKALAENYLKKSSVVRDTDDILEPIKAHYFSELKNKEEAFKAYTYIMCRMLEYIYIPMWGTGGLEIGGFEKDYPLLN